MSKPRRFARAVLTLTCGDPIRAATTALALVAIATVAVGSGWDLARAVALTSVAASVFTLLYGVLMFIADANGAVAEPPAPVIEDAGDGQVDDDEAIRRFAQLVPLTQEAVTAGIEALERGERPY